jgi:hypothetical protein
MLKNAQPYVGCKCPLRLAELIEIDANLEQELEEFERAFFFKE